MKKLGFGRGHIGLFVVALASVLLSGCVAAPLVVGVAAMTVGSKSDTTAVPAETGKDVQSTRLASCEKAYPVSVDGVTNYEQFGPTVPMLVLSLYSTGNIGNAALADANCSTTKLSTRYNVRILVNVDGKSAFSNACGQQVGGYYGLSDKAVKLLSGDKLCYDFSAITLILKVGDNVTNREFVIESPTVKANDENAAVGLQFLKGLKESGINVNNWDDSSNTLIVAAALKGALEKLSDELKAHPLTAGKQQSSTSVAAPYATRGGQQPSEAEMQAIQQRLAVNKGKARK